MKRFLFLVLGLVFLMSSGVRANADTTQTSPPPVPAPKRVQAPEPVPTPNNRMNDLEQRLRWVEDEIHQLTDKSRELERRVDDLRERQNSRL